MKVWRWENPEGHGPYVQKAVTKLSGASKKNKPTVSMERWEGAPSQWCDGVKETPTTRFGFSLRRQELWWFSEGERRKMRARGWRLVCYHVPASAVVTFHRQCIFDTARARRLRVED